eukprot:PLAT14002.1.p1 GENE.PLAT14002.1~~PLAT14002.1.p1  ORF type:complete len:498 (-),score=172.61 PLAT14002.1:160-1521(-)
MRDPLLDVAGAGDGSSELKAAPATGFRKYLALLRGKQAWLALTLAVMVISRTVDQTLYYRISFSYTYYVWYFASVILAAPWAWPVVWYKMAFTKEITPKMRQTPQYKFAIMGLFDTLYNIFSTFPVPHLGGDLSNVLNQTILPFNMLGSWLFLKAKFKGAHYLGAVMVVYGVLVKLSPSFGTATFQGSIGWILLMVLSQTPAAASNVYKEIALKEYDLDVWYASAWIGVYQLLWGALTFWTVLIPAFVYPHPPITLSSFGDFIHNANQCFVGNTVDVPGPPSFEKVCAASVTDSWQAATNGTATDAFAGVCHVDCDVDGSPLQVYLVYVFFNYAYNVLSLYIFREGSSVLFVIANAVRLPLVDALNAVPFVSGAAQESFGRYDALALFALIVAIAVYYTEDDGSGSSADDSKKTDGDDADDGSDVEAPRTDTHSFDGIKTLPTPAPVRRNKVR